MADDVAVPEPSGVDASACSSTAAAECPAPSRSGGECAPFLLRQELAGHSKCVRCCCLLADERHVVSGGVDGAVLLWRIGEPDAPQDAQPLGGLTNIQTFTHLSSASIYSLARATSAPGELLFFMGSQDATAQRVDALDGQVLSVYVGHGGSVCSLVEFAGGSRLASGAWDGSVRLWDVLTGAQLHVLEGHSHAVCVAALGDGRLVTGAQDKALRFWSQDGRLLDTVQSAHDDIIRSIDVLDDRLVTSSNDQTIRVWSLSGELLETLAGHSSFVFSVQIRRRADSPGRLSLVSAGEDATAVVWTAREQPPHSLEKAQTLYHNASVWQVGELPNGDLLTCCEDCLLRVWTRDEGAALPLDQRREKEEAAKQVWKATSLRAEGEGAPDVSKLPDVSHTQSLLGRQEGEVKMFAERGKAMAFMWTAGRWERVGEIVGNEASGGQKFYNGDAVFPSGFYDSLFNVELSEGGEYRILPYRSSDNPLEAAEKFCAREGIGRHAVETVAAFVRQHAPNAAATPSVRPSPPPVASEASPRTSSAHFPAKESIKFDRANWDAVLQKILDTDSHWPADAPEKLSPLEEKYVTDTIRKLKEPHFVAQTFRSSEFDLVYRHLMLWPVSASLPVLDLWRGLALHPQSHDVHKGCDDGWPVIAYALRAAQANPNAGPAVCAVRFLANLFQFPTNRLATLRHIDKILESLTPWAIQSTSAAVRLAFASLLVNVCVELNEKDVPVSLAPTVQSLRSLLAGEKDVEVFYRAVVALGTAAHRFPEAVRSLDAQLGLRAALSPAGPHFPSSDSRVSEAARDLLRILSR
eukprot:GHVT01012127.1.p1 GENE.GHVT01012127.1~~GHVT01012127.1.p1  ORF type:complete len:809 (-),score=239.99 GHVT01012127.1:669-3095(-)